ncbi:hypothetical protein Vretifemale_10134 [Volvox reticuliferus]|uniref:Uncharacterized protein n=1 Tax=Volvox reticuliferus TaxID=1737510 RepID=A0A8J4FNH0_9CHLO|nr:hypothetical protein Vretifemale_10134 [Volvox reticuliferus]
MAMAFVPRAATNAITTRMLCVCFYSNITKSMDVNFRLMDINVVAEQMLVPCKGAAAKQLGKRKLEEQTMGIPVLFQSYKDGQDHRERFLPDDANLQRGATLTYTTNMQFTQKSRLVKLMIPLYRDKLQTTVAKIIARLFRKPVTSFKVGWLKAALTSDGRLATRMAAVLRETGCKQSSEQFAEELDATYGTLGYRFYYKICQNGSCRGTAVSVTFAVCCLPHSHTPHD